MQYTVNRYYVLSTVIEAETPEEALLIEESLEFPYTFNPNTRENLISEVIDASCNDAWVDDDTGETVLDN
jgi:hypothetical protein